MMNISKKQFPSFTTKNGQSTDRYFIYDARKSQVGNWINVWFPGQKRYNKKSELICDEMWTVKRVDEVSSRFLYNRKVNPVSVNVNAYGSKVGITYVLSAMIHSIDDSSFTARKHVTLNEVASLREKIMKWVDVRKELNGKEFIEFCYSIGLTEIDYN